MNKKACCLCAAISHAHLWEIFEEVDKGERQGGELGDAHKARRVVLVRLLIVAQPSEQQRERVVQNELIVRTAQPLREK